MLTHIAHKAAMNQNKKKKMLREALLFVCFGVALSIGLVTHVMHEARRARVSVELAGVVAMSATAATLVVIVAAVCLGVATRN